MRTTYWAKLFFWIVIGVGPLAACGFHASLAADETLDDSDTVDEQLDTLRALEKMLKSGGGPVSDDNPLRGSQWTLESGRGPAGDIIPGDSSAIDISFSDETLSFGGNSGCNQYDGIYSIEGSTITYLHFFSTLMGCAHGAGEFEDAYYAALADVDRINLQGDEMTLSGTDTELTFFRGDPLPVAALLDKLWILKELSSNDEVTAPVGEPATLRIDSDGSFTGTTGCRTFTGRYRTSRTSIAFNEMTADGNCPTSLSDQDGQVMMVLGDEFTVAINGSALIVLSGNQRLRYGEADEDEASWLSTTSAMTDAEILDGIEWIFVGGESPDGPIADPRSIDSSSSISLTFNNDQYSGNALCNAYSGEANLDAPPRFAYDELKGDRLSPFTLGVPEVEEESCGDELDEIAAAYRRALPLMSTGGFYSAGQGLYMYTFDSDEEFNLRFERAE